MKIVEASQIPPSKSLYNRALILRSFAPELKILSMSEFESEDLILLRKALDDLSAAKNHFFCGAGAGPLKFLALRLSREKGTYYIEGTERLFSRPLSDLIAVLEQVGCSDIVLKSNSLAFKASGIWPSHIKVNASKSSQVLSAILLSSWQLEAETQILIEADEVASFSYLEMTLSLMRMAGWCGDIQKHKRLESIQLPKGQRVALDEILIEPDMSCVAVLALAGALKGGIRFRDMPSSSLQGDSIIFSLLGPPDLIESPPPLRDIEIENQIPFNGIEVDLFATPDLFPILAAYCVSARSPSTFKGLQNLNLKESKRLERMRELLTSVGIQCEVTENTFRVLAPTKINSYSVTFNPDQDHRLAMAASLLKLQGAKITIENPEVVTKSFPNFWSHF